MEPTKLPRKKHQTLYGFWNMTITKIESDNYELYRSNCVKSTIKIRDHAQVDEAILRIIDSPFKAARTDRILIDIQRSQQQKNYAENQLNFYTNDESFIRKYKKTVSDNNWEARKVQILQDKENEQTFLSMLEGKIENELNEQEVVLSNIAEVKRTIQQMANNLSQLNQLRKKENGHIVQG